MSFSFLDSLRDRGEGVRDEGKEILGKEILGKEEAGDLREECCERLRGLGLEDLAGRLRVVWNERMRSCAGRAIWPSGLIQLNPQLVKFSDREVRRTLWHELAHLVAYERNPRRRIQPHGREWQQACVDLGIAGEKVTHQLPLRSRSLQKNWRYVCPVCEEGIERMKRFQREVACYHCCRRENGGKFDVRFLLEAIDLRDEGGGSGF